MTTIVSFGGSRPDPEPSAEAPADGGFSSMGTTRSGTRTPIAAWLDIVARWRPVTLDAVNQDAALQTRVDRKYVLAATSVAPLFRALDADVGVLRIDDVAHMGYESTYFDTPTRACYVQAARSRPNRYKVRTRAYLDTDLSVLEVKVRPRNAQTIKERFDAYDGDHEQLSERDLDFVAATVHEHLPTRDLTALHRELKTLEPALRTTYRRSTLLVPGADVNDATTSTRATVDTDVAFVGADGVGFGVPQIAIVETKTSGLPSAVDRLLWHAGHRPTTISKYGVGMAVLDPSLPANKWNRVLRRNFGWTPDRA